MRGKVFLKAKRCFFIILGFWPKVFRWSFWLSKQHSMCPERELSGKVCFEKFVTFSTFSNLEREIFGLLGEKIQQSCQNCFLSVTRKFLREIVLKTFPFLEYERRSFGANFFCILAKAAFFGSSGLIESFEKRNFVSRENVFFSSFSDCLPKNSRRVVKTAFYKSSWAFWRWTFFWAFLYFFPFFKDFEQGLPELWQNFCHRVVKFTLYLSSAIFSAKLFFFFFKINSFCRMIFGIWVEKIRPSV